jgi:ABC-2 type transport system permease protein
MRKRSAFVEMLKGRWREFVREPSALFFVVLMPVIWMAILGFAFSGDTVVRYGVGWRADLPGNAAVKAALATSDRVTLREGDADAMDTWLKRGDVQLIISSTDTELIYMYDPANRESQVARLVVSDVIERGLGRQDKLGARDTAISVPGTRYIDFLVPGLLALTIMTTSLFGTGHTIVANRRENLLKRYMATPMQPFSYILSHIVGRGFILVVEIASVLGAAWLMYRFVPAGSMMNVVLVSALGAAAFTAIAMLFGARSSSLALVSGMINLATLPMMIVAGVWFSRSNFPDWISSSARFLPLTPLVDGLRRVALEGANLADISFEITVLGVYAIVAAVAAKLIFRWY